MTQITIPALPVGDALNGAEPFETVQNGVSVRTTAAAIAALAPSSQGTQGPPGPAGVSVSSASINGAGHLIITLSNGSSIDAGLVSSGGSSGGVALTLTDGSAILLTDGSGLTT